LPFTLVTEAGLDLIEQEEGCAQEIFTATPLAVDFAPLRS
jgi:hypothetical protein